MSTNSVKDTLKSELQRRCDETDALQRQIFNEDFSTFEIGGCVYRLTGFGTSGGKVVVATFVLDTIVKIRESDG